MPVNVPSTINRVIYRKFQNIMRLKTSHDENIEITGKIQHLTKQTYVELFEVFDDAWIEIWKLVHRDSFARFRSLVSFFLSLVFSVVCGCVCGCVCFFFAFFAPKCWKYNMLDLFF